MYLHLFPSWVRGPSVTIALICIATEVMQAQNVPQLKAVFPLPGQNAISTSASIIIRTPAEFDPRSLTLQAPNAERTGWRPTEPTVLLLRENIAKRTNRSRWVAHAVAGRTTTDDTRTIRWTPNQLLPNTTYRCVVSGVALDERHSGELCARLEYTFTTVRDVPQIQSCTLDSVSVITCAMPLTIRITQPLPLSNSLQKIFVLESPRGDGSWRRVETAITLDPQRQVVSIYSPNGWNVGNSLRLRCQMSTITGDQFDNRTYECIVRGAGKIQLHVKAVDGRPVPKDVVETLTNNDNVSHHGTAFVATVPDNLPNHWRFIRWESTDLPHVNGLTTLRLDATIPCELYAEVMAVNAVIEHIDSIGIVFEGDTGGIVDVYDQEGEHLAKVESTKTLFVSTRTTKLTCIATARQNNAFKSWSSTIPGLGGATGATITIPKLVLMNTLGWPGGAINNQPQVVIVTPRFYPLIPSRLEVYRLVARLTDTDPDPLFNVAEGISFSTAQEFEDAVQVTRTVCAQASRCWEITGYHDPAVGPPVWFDKGRAELCLTATLLNPENAVVIFARRKQIDLRVERVLLGSEDPNNVLVGKLPHAETRVDVERRCRVNGFDVWVPTAHVTCEHGGKPYARYAFHCGDNIRFVVRAATKRGEEWRWWARLPRYAIPAVESITEKIATYTMVMDLDVAQFDAVNCLEQTTGTPEVRMQAAFRQYFGIASIGLRVRGNARGVRSEARFEERWFDPATYYDLDSDEPRSGRQLEYVPRKGTSVKVKFTMPVDGPSVLAGAMRAESSDNLLVTDPHAEGLDFAVRTGTNGNTNFLPTNGQSADIVEFFICDPTTRPIKQALHGGIIDLTCSTGLMSASGDPLRTDHMFTLRRMELPGYGLRLREADIAYDGDWDIWPFENNGEIYHAMYGADLAVDAALLTSQGFARIPDCGQQQGSQGECTNAYSDKEQPQSFGDKVVWLQTAWMGESDVAWWAMSTWDEDCKDENDCLVNRLGDVINSVRKRAETYGSNEPNKELDWETILPDLIKTGADLIGALIAPDEQDEHLGEASFLEDRQELWGMRTATAPRIEARHENITYRLRGQWYVSRSVVR